MIFYAPGWKDKARKEISENFSTNAGIWKSDGCQEWDDRDVAAGGGVNRKKIIKVLDENISIAVTSQEGKQGFPTGKDKKKSLAFGQAFYI